jgi:hypothetical protein
MRYLLHLFSLLLLSGGLSLAGCLSATAQPTAVQGGQLTYTNVGPNQYVVTLHMYRDCSGAALPPSMTLAVQSGCAGATAPGSPFAMSPVPNSLSVGMQYCPAQQLQAQCTPGATLPNYESQQYRTATITIPDGQWQLSTEICCRPSTANLVGNDNFRFEAVLNNRIVVNGQNVSINSSSPQYSAMDSPVTMVFHSQSNTIRFNTSDPDNTALNIDQDSLVYSLAAPLKGCNDFPGYQVYPGTSIIVLPTSPPCVIAPPANQPPSYSPTLPVAVAYNTIGQCPVLQSTSPKSVFMPMFGYFTFTPSVFVPGPPVDGRNKYVVVGQVDEYRRLPGSNRRYLIGSVRREMLVVVLDPAIGNHGPNPPSGFRDNVSVTTHHADTLRFTLYTCSYSHLRILFTDPDPTDRLTVTYTGPGTINNDVLLNGAIGTYQLLGNGTAQPEILLRFQPAADMVGRVVLIPLRIEDNGCPSRAIRNCILRIPIQWGNLLAITDSVSSTPMTAATVCAGNAITLSHALARPDSVMDATTGATLLQQYRFAWTATGTPASSGLTAAQASNSRIHVSPTVTTRYSLRVTPQLGFSQLAGSCADTSSVLVRVVLRPAQPVISRAGNVLTSSASSGNQWYLNGVAISGATGSSFTPTTSGSYTVMSSVGSGPAVCSSPMSAPLVVTSARQALPGSSLRIAPNPTLDGHLTVHLMGYRQATTLDLFDAVGRLVHSATIAAPNAQGTAQALDLSALPTGVYALRVSTAGGVDVCRVVRQ